MKLRGAQPKPLQMESGRIRGGEGGDTKETLTAILSSVSKADVMEKRKERTCQLKLLHPYSNVNEYPRHEGEGTNASFRFCGSPDCFFPEAPLYMSIFKINKHRKSGGLEVLRLTLS